MMSSPPEIVPGVSAGIFASGYQRTTVNILVSVSPADFRV